jgi:hypothetical protein
MMADIRVNHIKQLTEQLLQQCNNAPDAQQCESSAPNFNPNFLDSVYTKSSTYKFEGVKPTTHQGDTAPIIADTTLSA